MERKSDGVMNDLIGSVNCSFCKPLFFKSQVAAKYISIEQFSLEIPSVKSTLDFTQNKIVPNYLIDVWSFI